MPRGSIDCQTELIRIREILTAYLAAFATDLTALTAALAAVQADVGDATGTTLGSLTAILGNPPRSLDDILGSRWDGASDLGTDIAAILTSIGAPTGSMQGLLYHGVVTAVPGANQFTIATLAGEGAGQFADATNPYWAFVQRDAGGASAAPQGEVKAITGFVTGSGAFTTEAFTAAVDVDDEVLIIHPSLARLISATAADSTAVSSPMDTIGNKADTALYVATATASLMRYLKAILQANVVAYGTFTTSSATVPADTGRTEANDYFKGHSIMPLTGVAAGQVRPIRQYTATTDVFTLDEPFTVAPGLVTYIIVKDSYPVQRLLDIFNETNAILELTETGSTITTDGTEQTVYINNIPAAVFKPLALQIDTTNMVAGDQIEVRTYYRNKVGGNLIKRSDVVWSGSQDPAEKTIDLTANRHGIQVTITRLVGTDRAYDCTVLYEG